MSLCPLHRLFDLGHPDIYPQKVNQIEDALTPETLRNGYINRPDVDNETFSGHDVICDRIQYGSLVEAMNSALSDIFAIHQNQQRITAIPPFRIPQRVAMTEPVRTQWIQDLTNPNIPLSQLVKQIPHGFKCEKMIEVLLQRNVPVPRIVFFIQIVSLNELVARKRDSPVEVTAEWTLAIISLLKRGFIDKAGERLSALIAAFVERQLVDARVLLDGILSIEEKSLSFKQMITDLLPLFLQSFDSSLALLNQLQMPSDKNLVQSILDEAPEIFVQLSDQKYFELKHDSNEDKFKWSDIDKRRDRISCHLPLKKELEFWQVLNEHNLEMALNHQLEEKSVIHLVSHWCCHKHRHGQDDMILALLLVSSFPIQDEFSHWLDSISSANHIDCKKLTKWIQLLIDYSLFDLHQWHVRILGHGKQDVPLFSSILLELNVRSIDWGQFLSSWNKDQFLNLKLAQKHQLANELCLLLPNNKIRLNKETFCIAAQIFLVSNKIHLFNFISWTLKSSTNEDIIFYCLVILQVEAFSFQKKQHLNELLKDAILQLPKDSFVERAFQERPFVLSTPLSLHDLNSIWQELDQGMEHELALKVANFCLHSFHEFIQSAIDHVTEGNLKAVVELVKNVFKFVTFDWKSISSLRIQSKVGRLFLQYLIAYQILPFGELYRFADEEKIENELPFPESFLLDLEFEKHFKNKEKTAPTEWNEKMFGNETDWHELFEEVCYAPISMIHHFASLHNFIPNWYKICQKDEFIIYLLPKQLCLTLLENWIESSVQLDENGNGNLDELKMIFAAYQRYDKFNSKLDSWLRDRLVHLERVASLPTNRCIMKLLMKRPDISWKEAESLLLENDWDIHATAAYNSNALEQELDILLVWQLHLNLLTWHLHLCGNVSNWTERLLKLLDHPFAVGSDFFFVLDLIGKYKRSLDTSVLMQERTFWQQPVQVHTTILRLCEQSVAEWTRNTLLYLPQETILDATRHSNTSAMTPLMTQLSMQTPGPSATSKWAKRLPLQPWTWLDGCNETSLGLFFFQSQRVRIPEEPLLDATKLTQMLESDSELDDKFPFLASEMQTPLWIPEQTLTRSLTSESLQYGAALDDTTQRNYEELSSSKNTETGSDLHRNESLMSLDMPVILEEDGEDAAPSPKRIRHV